MCALPTVYSPAVNAPASACAICGVTVGGAEPAHAVRDKLLCEACRRLVLASQPRQVLPYADAAVRRRRWLWPALATAAAAVLLASASILFTARRAAVDRARAEQIRAIAAQQRALAAEAAAVRSRLAETQPAD
jgi:hypothetical protein